MPLRSPPALFAISTLIWGSTWLAIKFQLGVVASEASVAYRFALAALLLGAWCMATGRSLRFDRRQHAFIALQGALLFGFNYVGVYWAEPMGGSLGNQRGAELGLGAGLPLLGTAAGPWFRINGQMRWDETSSASTSLWVTLEWRALLNTGLTGGQNL